MKKYPVLLFIAGLAILILLQSEIIMPLINKVVQSDLFLVESKDEGSQVSISNTMTDTAFMHCNTHIKSQIKNDTLISFTQKPINVWSIGNYQYVVNAEYSTTKANQTAINKYACRITYKNGDATEGAADFNNWEVIGLSDPNQQ